MYTITQKLKDYYNSRTYPPQKKWLDHNKNLILSPQTGLPFPATPIDIELAEYKLGFVLPTLLKELYLEISNGGFGLGIMGLNGGWRDGVNFIGNALEAYIYYKEVANKDNLTQEWEAHFKGLLPIKNAGCLNQYLLDCRTDEGKIWLWEECELETDQSLKLVANSLENWLEQWLSEAHEAAKWSHLEPIEIPF